MIKRLYSTLVTKYLPMDLTFPDYLNTKEYFNYLFKNKFFIKLAYGTVQSP